MMQLLIRSYRFYCFYMSPAKYVIRKTIIDFFQQHPPCKICLEIGSGNAMMSSVLRYACRAEKYVVSDIEPSDKTTLVCDAQNLPLPDSHIDLIAAFEVIEHIPDTVLLLSEIDRVLKPEGYVVLSMPFIYGRHDFQDFHRWTAQGLERMMSLCGMEMRLRRNRGGTFLSITTLISNYIHSIFSPSSGSWRARGMRKKLYFGFMSMIMFPLVVLSWLSFWLDLLIDRNSANPSGFVCIAQKKGNNSV